MKLKFLKKQVSFFVFGTLLCSVVFAELSEIRKIAFCGAAAGWPPFHYIDNGKIVGYDVDFAAAILEGTNIEFSVEIPPWKRCLSETDRGKTYQVAFSSSYKDDRAKTYIYTDSYYQLTGYYFYSKKAYPLGLNITSVDQIRQYQICGLSGYNYDNFGVKTETLDLGTKNFEALVEKTKRKRCDIFLARYEALKGFSLVGKDYLGDDIEAKRIPWMKGDKFYLLVSRNYSHAAELTDHINKGIKRLKQEGSLDRILQRYIEN